MNMKLKRGINLGGFLSQCEHSEKHYDAFIGEKDIQVIANWGFDHVRLPVDYEVLEDETGKRIEDGYQRLHTIIGWCRAYKLDIILDLHKAPGYDFNNAGSGDEAGELNNLFHNDALKERFLNLWKNIASDFAKYDNVAFELLNEVVEEENATLWNELIARTVTEIRGITAETPIIYGGIQWNSVRTLKLLEVPKDKNIIFTFHFYEPLLFTHQKAHWVKAMDPNKTIPYPESMEYYCEESKVLGFQGEVVGKAASKTMGPEFIGEMIGEAVEAAQNAGVSLYCGEFGVIDQAPVEDSLRWFTDVDTVFRHYDIGCSVWTYKEMDFGLIGSHYDPIRNDLISLWTQGMK